MFFINFNTKVKTQDKVLHKYLKDGMIFQMVPSDGQTNQMYCSFPTVCIGKLKSDGVLRVDPKYILVESCLDTLCFTIGLLLATTPPAVSR